MARVRYSLFNLIFQDSLHYVKVPMLKKDLCKIIYSALHINLPFARFIKTDVALAWLNIKFSSLAHLKQLSANFHLTIQKFQKSQGY